VRSANPALHYAPVQNLLISRRTLNSHFCTIASATLLFVRSCASGVVKVGRSARHVSNTSTRMDLASDSLAWDFIRLATRTLARRRRNTTATVANTHHVTGRLEERVGQPEVTVDVVDGEKARDERYCRSLPPTPVRRRRRFVAVAAYIALI